MVYMLKIGWVIMRTGKTFLNKKISLEDIGLYDKMIFAFVFMFVIPMLLTLYLIFLAPRLIDNKDSLLTHIRIIIVWMTACGLLGYLFIRRTIKTLVAIIKQAEELSLGSNGQRIDVAWNDELKALARSFNKIKSDLETKIKELQYSRSLTRELFQRMGHAMTSSQKMEALLNIIVHGMRKVLETQSTFIALYDNDNKLYLKAYAGSQKDLRGNMMLSDVKGAIGRTILNLGPIIIKKNPADKAEQGEDIIHYEANIACVPILVKDKLKGVLGATDKAGIQNVDKEDIFLLENVASQIAICVENMELSKDIEETYYNTLVMLARIVEARDPYSAGHLERVSSYVEMVAEKLDIDDETKKILTGGALLHDLGKVGIEDTILKKEGVLTPQEYEMMKQHSIIGENILKPLRSMSKLSSVVRHHHEMYDGTGYPNGLKGEEIPLAARILTVADIYDAITTDRPYRKAMSREEAIKTLISYAGNKLDPKLVEIFTNVI
ncbi:MAG: hypothetical protein A3I73_03880 [Omnitrophica bacterium RIFCSPLOWO2_02_FULL_45_16]|nr:MAG: hypothetical protein A3I73_03880 [Omnitrophica bacterium RIFCSPLOWO2_02_FULL_45_16]